MIRLSNITDQLQKVLQALYRHRVTIFVVVFVGIYVFLVTQISSYTQREPDASTGEQAIKRLKIDEASIEKLEDLEDQNVEVKALFEEARKNPFSE